MALLGGIQCRDLPGQIVIPRPGAELVDAHRHSHPRQYRVNLAVSRMGYLPVMGLYVASPLGYVS